MRMNGRCRNIIVPLPVLLAQMTLDLAAMYAVAAWGPAEPITELQVEEDEELYEDTILPSIV